MTSLVYRHPRVYRGVLALLYRDALAQRERFVAAHVPPGSTVVDVCCGDGGIRRRLRGVRYVGVDVSPVFVDALARAGVEAVRLDVAREDPPEGDVVLLLGALYQFLPDADAVVERLRRAARRHVVLAEPHRNLAQSRNPLLRAIARRATDPGVASSTARFDGPTLRALLERHGAREVLETRKELVAVLPGRAS
ncbi:MAG: class I SAM-dependent methyltransferase [Planctomycetes bacterium]|nr:class I SAM-dependent methyltransferase [Planctomycetota bacterium]